MGILIKGMDEIPEDGAVLVVKHDNGKAYIKHACTYGYSMELVKLPAVQPDHNADSGKMVCVDVISRQAALDAMKDMHRAAEEWLRDATDDVTKARAESCMASLVEIKLRTEKLPAVQPDHVANVGKKVEQTAEIAQNVQNEDLIQRKWLVECIEEGWVKFDTAKDCNRMMHLVRDIAPSVQPVLACKGCRYDGHYTRMQCRNCLRKERDLYAPE